MKRIDYAIFQLREDMEDNIPIRFANYSSLEKMGVTPTIDRYQEVYRGTLTELEDARSDSILEKLYEKFNLRIPEDFKEKYPKAHLSISGRPESCCACLGYCKECWNMPIDD